MFSSIRARVVFACIALVVFSVISSTVTSYLIANASNEEAIDRNLTSVANDHAVAIGEWVAAKTRMISSLQDVVLAPDPEAMLKQVASAGGFFDVGVGYPDKSAFFTDWPNIPSTYDPTSRPWYRDAAQAGRPIVMPYVSTSGALLVAFAVPVVRGGIVKAVVVGDFAMSNVVASIRSIRPSPTSFGMLIDNSGRIIAHPDPKLTFRPATDIASKFGTALLTAATAPVEVRVNEKTKLVRAQSVPGTDWHVVIALDKTEATAGMRSLLRASLVSLIVIAGIASVIVGVITTTAFRRLRQVCQAMAAIGSGAGDLTRRLSADCRDEVANIARSFNRFVDRLQSVMLQIRDASESVRVASNEIADASRDLSCRTESAAASLEQTAASMDEISGTVDRSAAAAREADERSAAAAQIASHGGVIVSEVVATMVKIEGASDRIGAIIGVIDGIAFQTNLLALNAAVEAARAGEQGRGFAVVAQEVRSLAQRSAQAAREVKELVESTVASVTAGSVQVRQAGATMSEIVTHAANVQTIISGITRAANEQTRGIQEVNCAVAQIEGMVQQNAALVEQSAAAATSLQTQASALASTIGQFKVT